MMCLIGDGSPIRLGIAWDVTPAVPRVRRPPASSKPLFRTTRAVNASRPAGAGTGMIERLPVINAAMNCSDVSPGPRVGFGPRGFGPAPRPFAFVTKRVAPSREAVMVVGYQAVGIKPRIFGEAP